ncbi:hypothetical protein PP707_01305 [Acetobacter pasteurianus]|nr:hypothetical protein [Acetobacter pasteurianus]
MPIITCTLSFSKVDAEQTEIKEKRKEDEEIHIQPRIPIWQGYKKKKVFSLFLFI